MSERSNPRRVFDREITLAYWRWEFLRRNVAYKRDVEKWLTLAAETLGWEPDRFKSYCRREAGIIIYPPFGAESENYERDCTKWGLHFLILPEIKIASEGMAAFPIFVDTPSRQPTVRDPP